MPVNPDRVDVPHLLPGRIVDLPGRGEMFVRHHVHADASRPTVLLLHGWTASADTQFFPAYPALAEHYSVLAVDHRGHGRGLRPSTPFSLEDCADDAAEVVRALGLASVVTVGYSMGGPVSMLLWQRHGDLVDAMVFEATAMEWRARLRERVRWMVGRIVSPITRVATTPRTLRILLERFVPRGHELHRHLPWLVGEIRRNDPWMVAEAGRAISRFDGRGVAKGIDVPTVVVVTTGDRLVRPRKQRALADAVRGEILELDADHLAPLQQPREFAEVTLRAVDRAVASRGTRPASRAPR